MSVDKNFDKIYDEFSSAQKVAVLLISLGQQSATELMRGMQEEDIKRISYWISQLKHVPQEITERVIKEFYSRVQKKSTLSSIGGKEYLMDVLTGIIGENKAKEKIDTFINQEEYELFRILNKVDPNQLASYLKKESHQTIALMLSHIEPRRAGLIIAAFPEEMQLSLIMTLARMEKTDSTIVYTMEKALNKEFAIPSGDAGMKKSGGIESVAKILNSMKGSVSKVLMTQLSEEDFDLAAEVKDLMFVFEDISLLDDKSIQLVIKEVDQGDLILAIKGSGAALKDKLLGNISKRQAESIVDELDFMGPVKGGVVRQAQQRIVNIIRKLDEEGKILILSSSGGEDEVFE